MFKIINRTILADSIVRLEIKAPLIAAKAKAGQFVAVVNDHKGERIPLTLADWNKSSGTISLIFQEVGFTTHKLAAMKAGDSVEHILGPLGHPTEIKKVGQVICIGGGVGIAEILPVSCAFKNAGNDVIGIIGARNKKLVFLENEMQRVCSQLYLTTDDGSCGRRGFVTDILKEILDRQIENTGKHADLVYAIGPVPMMHAVSELTRPFKIKTLVSLNPIMVDATGMCGACRCTIAGESKFACVDGPDFDAHEVDFWELEKRVNQFKQQERIKNEAEG